ncbi:hypothetical protein D8674_009948 [Pyrus ussuriensis x Pyrus communis]|uniref:Uncharacterized protein n=1 Tax=Pyrus ussuriensis x Pyrus communis TaxID=2448454 RepID=A0A5N5F9P5_9ROSA|nr:hypothetical protein D8674_009948 [Pyrus ussuriensis x Pyrus communis]
MSRTGPSDAKDDHAIDDGLGWVWWMGLLEGVGGVWVWVWGRREGKKGNKMNGRKGGDERRERESKRWRMRGGSGFGFGLQGRTLAGFWVWVGCGGWDC